MAKGENLNRLAYFVAVFETGSFTLAAERLGVTKSNVSRQVAQLEREVGVALLVRSTRRVSPSEAGKVFYLRCSEILVLADKAFAEMSLMKVAQQ
jgi:DNA-binding transcriptional LysR family regulator